MKPLRPMLIFTSLLAVTAFLLSVTFLGLVLGFIRQDLTAFGLKTGTYPLSGLTREEAAAQWRSIPPSAAFCRHFARNSR